MKTTTLFAATAILFSSSIFASSGETAFNNLCSSCHSTQGQSGIAPPIFGVIDHVKKAHPERDDFVQTVVDWVNNPTKEKALMPGAVDKFGVMPKLGYPEEQVREIAEYLFDGDLSQPAWYQEHRRKAHKGGRHQH